MSELRKVCMRCASESAIVSNWVEGFTLPACPNNPAHSLDAGTEYVDMESAGDVYFYRAGTNISSGNVVSITPANELVAGFGTPPKYMFESKSAAAIAMTSLSATTFVVAYTSTMSSPTANNGVAILGTIAGGGITYSAPVVFTGASGTALTSISLCALNSADFIIAWRAASTGGIVFGAAAAGALSFSTITSFNSTAPGNQAGSIQVVKVNSTQVIVVYRDTSNSGRGTWIVGTLSGSGIGTTAVWNTKQVWNTNTTANNQYALCCDVLDTSRIICAYDNNNTGLSVLVGTVSGTGLTASMTAGAAVAIDAEVARAGRDIAIAAIDANRALLVYRRSFDNNTIGRAVVLSISGTSITVGTPIDYTDSSGVQSPAIVRVGSTRFLVNYISTSTGNSLECMQLEIDGTSISRAGYCPHAENTNFNAIVRCGDYYVNGLRDGNFFNTGACMMFQIVGGETDFGAQKGAAPIGIAMAAASAGGVAKIYTGRLADFLSGLSAGAIYYAHGNGTISTATAPMDNSYLPKVIGMAQTSTQLFTKFN
jgi:hypothetical protein